MSAVDLRKRDTGRPYRCGFCAADRCERCPGSVRNGSAAEHPETVCECAWRGHQDDPEPAPAR